MCELRLGGHEQDVGVAEDLARLERPLGKRQLGEREVELAPLDEAEEVGDVRLLVHLHVDARPLLAKPPQERGEDARADALVDPDPKWAGGTLGQRGHVGLCRVELRDDGVRVPEQELPGLGERHGPRAAWPVEEPLPDDALEVGDLLAHRRLRVAELARRAAERLRASDGFERGQMAQLEPEESITFIHVKQLYPDLH